jgi:hypothetical protein
VGSWVSGSLFSYPDCASVPVFFNLPRLNVELPDEPEPSKTVDNLGDDLGNDVSDDLGEIEDIGGDDLGDADFDTD